ncbi:unnamed protein product, partial [Rotaria sp. Silwood1]
RSVSTLNDVFKRTICLFSSSIRRYGVEFLVYQIVLGAVSFSIVEVQLPFDCRLDTISSLAIRCHQKHEILF